MQITIDYTSQRQLERKVKAIMLQWGYTILPPNPTWTPMAVIRQRLAIRPNELNRILSQPECPDFPGKMNKRRRSIVVTPALKCFLQDKTGKHF